MAAPWPGRRSVIGDRLSGETERRDGEQLIWFRVRDRTLGALVLRRASAKFSDLELDLMRAFADQFRLLSIMNAMRTICGDLRCSVIGTGSLETCMIR